MLTPERIEKIREKILNSAQGSEKQRQIALIQAGYDAHDKEALELKTDAHGHNPREIKLPPNPFKEALELQDEEMLLYKYPCNICNPEKRCGFCPEYCNCNDWNKYRSAKAQLAKVQPTITALRAENERFKEVLSHIGYIDAQLDNTTQADKEYRELVKFALKSE